MKLSLAQIRSWLGLPGPPSAGDALGYSIDSRTLQRGDLFFAIRGPRHDGHDHLGQAFGRGAVAAVVRAAHPARSGAPLLRVPDPAEALRTVAARARGSWGGTVVAVTGSSGKTTTKEAVAALLATDRAVSKSEGNLNNEYGLPLSLLRVSGDAAAAVVEVGINRPGEMRPLARLATPDMAIVTNVGTAHVGNFASLEAIAEEKRGLVEELAEGGCAVLNADDARVRSFRTHHPGPTVTFGIEEPADIRAERVEDRGAAGVRFEVAGVELHSALPGRHNVYNLLAALAAASYSGLKVGCLRAAVARLRPAAMRGGVRQVAGVTVIDDCYNANPDAMEAMLRVLRRTKARRRLALLGEMRELGEGSRELHRRVGRATAAAALDYLVAVGGDAAEIAAAANVPTEFHGDPLAAAAALAARLEPGDAVLLKASRGVGLERARDALLEELGRRALAERTAA